MVDKTINGTTRAVVSVRSRRWALPAVLASLLGLAPSASATPQDGYTPLPADPERGDRVVLEGRLTKQAWPSRDASKPGATTRQSSRSRIGVRRICYAYCATSSGVWCTVTCPTGLQAVGGGLTGTDGSGGLGPTAPTPYYIQWATSLYSINGYATATYAYAVCLKT